LKYKRVEHNDLRSTLLGLRYPSRSTLSVLGIWKNSPIPRIACLPIGRLFGAIQVQSFKD